MPRPLYRPLYGRIRLRGWLEVITPLHVGGLGNDVDVDLTLARDGLGRLYVPGTSLAGSISHWAHPTGERDHRWGSNGESKKSADWNDWRASRVIVGDGVILACRPDKGSFDDLSGWKGDLVAGDRNDGPVTESRDGVGIDRVTGTAASGILYRREVVPRGAVIRLSIDMESQSSDEYKSDLYEMAVIAEALCAGDIRLGAAKTRGLGAVKLHRDSVAVKIERLDTKEGMLHALTGETIPKLKELTTDSGESGHDDGQGDRTSVSLGQLIADAGGSESVSNEVATRQEKVKTITIKWHPVGPLMVRAGMDGIAVDSIPLMGEYKSGYVRQVLPGSSVKGALRTRAELILRTLLNNREDGHDDIADHGASRKRFLNQMAGEKLITWLFGSANTKDDYHDDKADDETGQPKQGIGALSVLDCYAVGNGTDDDDRGNDMGTKEWIKVFTEAKPQGKPKEGSTLEEVADSLKMHRADHVAIDRWTGGAAEHFLYSTLEPDPGKWEPLQIRIDESRLPEKVLDPARALVLVVLRDLAHGFVPIGYSTNRGMGDIAVDSIEHPWKDAISDLEEKWKTWLEDVS